MKKTFPGKISRTVSPHSRGQPAGVDAEHVALHDVRGIGDLPRMLGNGHLDCHQQTHLHKLPGSLRAQAPHARGRG